MPIKKFGSLRSLIMVFFLLAEMLQTHFFYLAYMLFEKLQMPPKMFGSLCSLQNFNAQPGMIQSFKVKSILFQQILFLTKYLYTTCIRVLYTNNRVLQPFYKVRNGPKIYKKKCAPSNLKSWIRPWLSPSFQALGICNCGCYPLDQIKCSVHKDI